VTQACLSYINQRKERGENWKKRQRVALAPHKLCRRGEDPRKGTKANKHTRKKKKLSFWMVGETP